MIIVPLKNARLKKISAGSLLFCACLANAEGIIDIHPTVGANFIYDDNVFRFSSPAQAQQAFGSSATSDFIKQLDVGVNADLRLSRQLIRASANVSDIQYNRFGLLDNVAKNYVLAWDWRIGSDLFGTLNASKSESIAGFTEIRNPVRNTRLVDRQSASVNWRFLPDWTIYASRDELTTENELMGFEALDRDDTITEAGVRYRNLSGTQLGLSYREVDSEYPGRTGFASVLFGDESVQGSLNLDATWFLTHKTRINARLSRVKIDYEDSPQREFSGISQRWDITHTLTNKVTLNASAYREVSPIDDILSTFIESTGASFNPSWAITSKLALSAGVGYVDREYLGSSGFVNSGFFIVAQNRNDNSKTANLGLIYTPTLKSVLQLQYQTEDRESTLDNQSFRFNSLSLVARYNF